MFQKSLKYLSLFRYRRELYSLFDLNFSFDRSQLSTSSEMPKVVARFLGSQDLSLINSYLEEAQEKYNEIVQRENWIVPQHLNGGPVFAQILYVTVKITKPKLVVETGVANGLSTALILAALEETSGELHSYDIDPRTSQSHEPNPKWKWHQLGIRNPVKSLNLELRKLGAEVDLWVHDSDHSRLWQSIEYKLASKFLSLRGILISDDINDSSAWQNFPLLMKKIAFVDGHKIVGARRTLEEIDQ